MFDGGVHLRIIPRITDRNIHAHQPQHHGSTAPCLREVRRLQVRYVFCGEELTELFNLLWTAKCPFLAEGATLWPFGAILTTVVDLVTGFVNIRHKRIVVSNMEPVYPHIPEISCQIIL